MSSSTKHSQSETSATVAVRRRADGRRAGAITLISHDEQLTSYKRLSGGTGTTSGTILWLRISRTKSDILPGANVRDKLALANNNTHPSGAGATVTTPEADEEHVPVQPGTLRRSGTDVIGQHVARIDVRAGDVTHQPVFPAAHLRIAARRCIRIGHQQRVEGARFHLPAQLRAGLYLGRRELIAERHFHVRLGVGDLDRLLRRDVDQIRHDFVALKRFGCRVRRLTANGHQR
uniref:Uncharacterized protein n=1 Tax=Anopheles merus TaxID=30066 RepID=A0A182UQW6_ANOME